MTKDEFLRELGLALSQEMPKEEVIRHLNYYENYIIRESVNQNEEIVIKNIGSPQLIAKTIIDAYKRKYGSAYKRMKQANKEDDMNSSYSSFKKASYDSSTRKDDGHKDTYSKNRRVKLPWYFIIFIILMILVLLTILSVLWNLFFILLKIALPIIIIIIIIRLIYYLFNK